jgi:hypothetical protein
MRSVVAAAAAVAERGRMFLSGRSACVRRPRGQGRSRSTAARRAVRPDFKGITTQKKNIHKCIQGHQIRRLSTANAPYNVFTYITRFVIIRRAQLIFPIPPPVDVWIGGVIVLARQLNIISETLFAKSIPITAVLPFPPGRRRPERLTMP